MFQTKNALNNLIARYKSVLTHCKLLNAGLLSCTLAVGVSTCIIFAEKAWADDLSGSLSGTYESGNVDAGNTLQVWSGTLAITTKLTNNGIVQLYAWNTGNVPSTITAQNVESNGKFHIDNSILTVSDTITNTGVFQVDNASSVVDANALVNSGNEFKVNGGTVNIAGAFSNSGNFMINGGTITADSLENFGDGNYEINGGTVDIDVINNTGNSKFIYHGGDLKTTSIINTSTYHKKNNDGTYDGGFTISQDISDKLTSIENGVGAYFGINNSSVATESLINSGTLSINSYSGGDAGVTITNLTNNKGATLVVNGDDCSNRSNIHLAVTNRTTNEGTFIFNTGANVSFNETLTNLGTVDVQNNNTNLTVDGDFVNGNNVSKGVLHIHENNAVVLVTGDLINTNGLVGVHSGTLTINGELINNSDSKSNVDNAHPTPQESIHVHGAELIVATLTLNKGGLGLYNGATGDFGKVTALSGSEIHAYGGSTFQADSGDIDGMFTIHNEYSYTQNGKLYHVVNGLLEKTGTSTDTLALSSLASLGDVKVTEGTLSIERGYNTGATSTFTVAKDATFTKNGGATDILTISNEISNTGTMNVSNGGLVVTNLKNNATYGNGFITNGDVIVTGKNSFLQTGDMHLAAIESLLNEGYAKADGTHTELTMLQATVALNDGVGVVLADNANLVVSNSSSYTNTTGGASVVDFGAGTLFKFNGHGFDRNHAAFTVVGNEGSVAIANDAKFLATNLTANTYYTLIANVASSQDAVDKTGWQKDVASGSLDRMIEDATIKYVPNTNSDYGASSTNDIVLASGDVTDKNFGVDDDLFENMKDLWEAGKNDKDSPNAGTGFVSGATDRTEIHDDGEAGKTLESALNVAVTGGVAGMTTDASDIASQAVNHRIDGVRAEAGDYYEDISATDWGLWAIPLYQQSQVRDMEIGVNSGGYDGYITGAIIGLDRKKDEWTFGAALGAGFGEAESVGNYASTKTQLDFWSAILYGGYHKGNFELKGDFTYTQTRSEINQDNPYHLVSMANISADVDSQLYSLGATASYKMEGEDIDVTPHIGVRYRAYHQDSFTSSLGGRDLFRVHDGHMETWLLPVGVTFSDSFLQNEWLITPRVDLSFTAVFGDTTIMNRVGIAGIGADVDAFGTASIEADVLDYGYASLSIGCGAKKENWSFGLDFDFQMSDRRKAQGVFARAAYRF